MFNLEELEDEIHWNYSRGTCDTLVNGLPIHFVNPTGKNFLNNECTSKCKQHVLQFTSINHGITIDPI